MRIFFSIYFCLRYLSNSHSKSSRTEKFGFRHFEFVEKGPFMLNGKRLLLRDNMQVLRRP